jgi:hypothetical protein
MIRPALPLALLALVGCVAAPVSTPEVPASSPEATRTATPSPAASYPPGWLAATFTDASGTNARTEPLDTRPSPATYTYFHVGANWSERFDMLHGQPTTRAFALDASQSVGQAPPPSLARNFELRLAAPPRAGERYDLTTDAPSAGHAQFWFADGYRFNDNVWQAEAGTVVFSAGEHGLLHAEIQGARMVPRFQGIFFGSDARGTFTLAAAGDFPVGLEPSPRPTATPSCPPPKGPDVIGLTVQVYDKAGRPLREPRTQLAVRISGTDPEVPYLAEGYTTNGAYYVGNAPAHAKVSVTVTAACGTPVTRAIVLAPDPGTQPPCGSFDGSMTVSFGGPASLQDPSAPDFAVDAPATGASQTCSP